MIAPEGQGQHRELLARRPNLNVSLATGTQITDAF